MRKKLFIIIGFTELFWSQCPAQISNEEIGLLRKLDSIQKSSSISKHFAELYFKTTVEAANFFLNSGKKEKDFINRLETRFGSFFFRSVEAESTETAIPEEWKAYFSSPDLSPVQYKLLGINAHINGDIWQALTAEFSLQELKENRESYLRFEKGLLKIYHDFYIESFEANSKIRLMSSISARMDKLYGKLLLNKWRKRQIELAMLYYTDKNKFCVRLQRLRQKMGHINHLILHNL